MSLIGAYPDNLAAKRPAASITLSAVCDAEHSTSENLRQHRLRQALIFWGVGGFRVRVWLSKRVVQRPTHWRTVRDFCDRPIKRSFASSTRLYQDTDRLCLRISGECFGSAKNWAKPFMRATLACALPVADQRPHTSCRKQTTVISDSPRARTGSNRRMG